MPRRSAFRRRLGTHAILALYGLHSSRCTFEYAQPMHITGVNPILNVSNVPTSIDWFEKLGFVRNFTYNGGGMIAGAALSNASGPAEFAGVGCGEVTIFLCQNAQGIQGGKPPRFDGHGDTGATWMSLWLKTPAEIDEASSLAKSLGITILWGPANEPWGVRECRIMHPDGHVFRLSARLHQH